MKKIVEKIRHIIYLITLNIYWVFFRNFFKRFKVLTNEKTIKLIIEKKLSISRFGDGELSLMRGNLKHIGFQTFDDVLSKELKQALNTRDERLLICVYNFYSEKKLNNDHGQWLKKYIFNNYKYIKKEFDYSYQYGNSCITRFYHPSITYSKFEIKYLKESYIPLLKQLWDGRNVLIVEGCHTRLGLGNDLFDNCIKIKRILCPDKNAFAKKKDIYDSIVKNTKKNDLVLLALGPTATILSRDLTVMHGFQCLDIGHIDIIYLWFLNQVKQKTKVSGKNNNEVSSSSENYINIIYDENEYKSQIIDVIE